MKQIAIISGKGGTGKTTITAALSSIFKDTVFADCDVDAPDLHLLLKPEIKKTSEFPGGKFAHIDSDKCSRCGLCLSKCRYSAIDFLNNNFHVDSFLCEGCGLCSRLCPVDAIKMIQASAGEWYVSRSRFGDMVHAKLYPGQENSGKLITMVRHQAKLLAEESGGKYILIDGPPGTGCPVISTITGTDHVILITEPTVSGIADFKRTWELAEHFKIPVSCIINK
ncbi:MAG TPA: (4Fe-4S)-binding protein, partial [Firmicutes bacterium]|nr:(4Fe-4S)-binding protein [Bacillota bacterium]